MKFAILLILLSMMQNISAKPLISAVSQNQILVDTKFKGRNILLFGARDATGEIILVVRGPKQNLLVTKKEKVAGIWFDRKKEIFNNVYGFYNFYTTMPLTEIKNQFLLQNLNIGLENLSISSLEAQSQEEDGFKQALIRKKQSDYLYNDKPGRVEFMGDTLFKATIFFPKRVPYGMYDIDVYLIDDENLVEAQSIPIEVKRTGLEAVIYKMAKEQKGLYAMISVLSALIAGWIASIIFWKV